MLAVIILAAGESRRMGQPKALIPLPVSPASRETDTGAAANPTTFLSHLVNVSRHPRAGMLRVVVGAHASEIRAHVKLGRDELVVNENWQHGQLSSLQAGIRSLPAGATDGILVCLVDHPLISAQIIAQLMDTFEQNKNKIVIPAFQGRCGHPVIFPASLYLELLNAPQEVGARAVIRAHVNDVLEIPVEEEGVLLNLNDPASVQRVSRME